VNPANSLPTAFRITDVREENYRTRTFVLDGRLDAAPGQFVMAWLPRFDEKPFSLVSADPLTLMVTAVGPFSRLMHERRPGDRLWLRGPFGRGFAVDDSCRRIVLVGGGYGVAPLYWLARSQSGVTPRVDCIVGARSADDLLFARSFNALHAASTDYSLTLTTEDGSVGLPGRVTDALAPMVEQGDVDAVYACGPHAMLAALDELCHQRAVPSQLSWEAYMRCGIGICGACEQDGKLLCLDGPVLPGRR
jgi:dihydroorotate dehydrogenase electron transfer subunit